MLRPRIVPCLLVSQRRLVKTTQFKNPVYLGDPLNAIRIFNEKGADEIVVLDVSRPRDRGPDFEYVAEMAGEAFMPFCYGGAVRGVADAMELVRCGVDKVAVNTAIALRPEIVSEMAAAVGSQSVVAAVDVRRGLAGRMAVVAASARKRIARDPIAYSKHVTSLGAGEILLTSVHREGTWAGYDMDLISRVSQAVGVPVIAHGGASSLIDLARAVTEGGAAAAAAGSLFMFRGRRRGILINYPSEVEMEDALAL